MIFRLLALTLFLAGSNASLLRGSGGVENEGEKKRRLTGDDAGGCGQKLAAETMIAFGLDPLMNCTEIARTDYGCVPLSDVPPLDPISKCTSSATCTSPNSCFYVPNQVGPAGLPVASCNTREGAAADVDGVSVNENVPKEICRDLEIAIP